MRKKMRKRFFLKIAGLILACAASAAAHPLGNFTVNHYTRIEIEKSQIKLRAVLDMAEIPTFQESQRIDLDKDGSLSSDELDAYAEQITPGYIANLSLFVNGEAVKLRPLAKSVGLPSGSGGLSTLRVEWDLIGDLPNLNSENRVSFENKNNAERIGWNEIVIARASGVNVFDSAAFGNGITDELKEYPQESLAAPLSERAATFSFTSNDLPRGAKVLQNRDGHISAPVEKDKFAELINVPEITLPVAFFGLLLAFGFGAMHALSPGHGKTVVGAYLIGSRGTMKHAMFLGLTVTVTHTLGVFALGLITLFASNYILPEKIMPFLGFVSGLMVFFIGVSLFKDRLFAALGCKTSGGHHHDHELDGYAHHHDGHTHSHDGEHGHQHAHDGSTHAHGGSTHTHLPPETVTWKNLLALGISGGLLPCPSALVLMLSAISAGRIGYGLILTTVFSFGLAATLTAVGLIFLYGGKLVGGSRLAESRIVKTLPVFSAFVIACVGAAICYGSLK